MADVLAVHCVTAAASGRFCGDTCSGMLAESPEKEERPMLYTIVAILAIIILVVILTRLL